MGETALPARTKAPLLGKLEDRRLPAQLEYERVRVHDDACRVEVRSEVRHPPGGGGNVTPPGRKTGRKPVVPYLSAAVTDRVGAETGATSPLPAALCAAVPTGR